MEPSQRLTCAELLTHAYFDDYKEDARAPPAVKTRKTRVSGIYTVIVPKIRKYHLGIPHVSCVGELPTRVYETTFAERLRMPVFFPI